MEPERAHVVLLQTTTEKKCVCGGSPWNNMDERSIWAQLHKAPAHHYSHGFTDTCDDDLGDIQNGAEWRCFTVASFILRLCCKYTHTATNTSMQMQTKEDYNQQLDSKH